MFKPLLHKLVRAGRRGLRAAMLPIRWLMCRILLPVLQRLIDSQNALGKWLEKVATRQEQLDKQMHAILYFGWDYVALVRRLAALEKQVQSLMLHQSGAQAAPSAPGADKKDADVAKVGHEYQVWKQAA